MTLPIAPAMPRLPSSPPGEHAAGQGANALTARRLPANSIPHVDRRNADPTHVKVAEGMEAMFLDYLMKTMRDTVPQNEMGLENVGTKIYTSMMDSEFAQRAARAGGVGLADQIIAYLESRRYTDNRGRVVPSADQGMVPASGPAGNARHTGGTHEGQLTE